MHNFSFTRLLALCCILIAAVTGRASATPLIYTIDPGTGAPGTAIDISGTGFSGVERVFFINRRSGFQVNAAFSGLSDTHVSTTVPSVGSTWLISLFTPLGATVTIPTDFFSITSPTVGGQGSAVYVVYNGGSLTGGFGSSTVFIETGGSYNGSSGSGTFFVQQGGTFSQHGGGSNLIFYEPGAIVDFDSGGGGGNIFTQVSSIAPSFLTVPEPSTVSLLVVGAAVIFFRRSPGSAIRKSGDDRLSTA